MAKLKIDLDKLRVQLRRLERDELLGILDDAVGLVPGTRLAELVSGCVDLTELAPDGVAPGGLLEAVRAFREASHSGRYYESFDVNSKNFMDTSKGTEAWIAECERLFERCFEAAEKDRCPEARESFDILFDLLRHVDQGNADVVFFADEGGSWLVDVRWERVLPAYFTCLASVSEPEEYAQAVKAITRDFVHHDRDRYLQAARSVATPAQKAALGAET